jgi:hypothetical protein
MIIGFIRRLARHAPAFAATVALSVGMLTAAAPARADLRIVQEKTITGLEESDFYSVPRLVTYYWKGDKYREDLPGGDIYFIYDCAKDRYYIVNNRERTYTIMTLQDALTQRKGIIKNMKVEGRASVDEGGTTKTIGGQKAKNYTLSMDVRLKMETSRGPGWHRCPLPEDPSGRLCARHLPLQQDPRTAVFQTQRHQRRPAELRHDSEHRGPVAGGGRPERRHDRGACRRQEHQHQDPARIAFCCPEQLPACREDEH